MWRCPIFRSRDWQFQDVSVNARNGENSLSPKASCPLHQWLAATSFCLIEFLSVSPPGELPVDLCCLVGLSASGTHTLQLQISLGRLKPTRFQLFLIAAFAVNVVLSQCNDPFFPQPRSRWGGLPGHGENASEGAAVGSSPHTRWPGQSSLFWDVHFANCFLRLVLLLRKVS